MSFLIFILCCVITVSLSRVLNYVLIRPNVYVPDVKENEIARFVMVLHATGNCMWYPVTTMVIR